MTSITTPPSAQPQPPARPQEPPLPASIEKLHQALASGRHRFVGLRLCDCQLECSDLSGAALERACLPAGDSGCA